MRTLETLRSARRAKRFRKPVIASWIDTLTNWMEKEREAALVLEVPHFYLAVSTLLKLLCVSTKTTSSLDRLCGSGQGRSIAGATFHSRECHYSRHVPSELHSWAMCPVSHFPICFSCEIRYLYGNKYLSKYNIRHLMNLTSPVIIAPHLFLLWRGMLSLSEHEPHPNLWAVFLVIGWEISLIGQDALLAGISWRGVRTSPAAQSRANEGFSREAQHPITTHKKHLYWLH